MEYSRFLAVCSLLIISNLTIYVGCLRSYAIYFFERDSRRVIFLESWSAAAVPVALSFMVIISYLTSKRSLATSEEIIAKQLYKSSQASIRSLGSRKFSRSSDLESIPESAAEDKKSEIMHSILESSSSENGIEEEEEEVKKSEGQEHARKPGMGAGDQFNEVLDSADRKLPDKFSEKMSSGEEGKVGVENTPDVIFTLEQNRTNEQEDEWLTSRKSSQNSLGGQCVQRKQSEIYKQIGKIDFVPMSLKKISFQVVNPTPIRRFRKDSLFDVVVQLLGIHLPIWTSVMAVYITLIEILSMKFYMIFYYHHPGLKLLAMFLAVLIGLFHEWKPTYFINNVLVIAGAYVVIARVQPVSYVAGIIFLTGMVAFDLFWMYGIDLLSTITKQTNAPIMLIIPWGKERKKEMVAAVDFMVPGIFLNIVLKFADMYDAGAFYPAFYATVIGLTVTFAIALHRAKSTPAMVLPALLSVIISLLSVRSTADLWHFEIKH